MTLLHFLPLKRWQRMTAYGAYTLFAFALCFYITFPYQAVTQRIVSEAASEGFLVQMGALGPGLLGVTAPLVRISRKPEENIDQENTVLTLRSVSLRPSLFPVGLAFRAAGLGGTVSGAYGGIGSTSVTFDLSKVNAADPGVKSFSGLDLSGSLNGHLALDIPKSKNPKAPETDLAQANGTLVLKLNQLLIKGGTVTVPIMGQPTPIDLPRVSIGDVEARVKFDKGLGKIEKFQGKGDDLELSATGTLTLAKRLDYAQPNIDLKLKADPDFVKRVGIIGSGLSMLPADRENSGFRVAKITGFLARPVFNPGQ